MDRRAFLKTTGTIVAASAVQSGICAYVDEPSNGRLLFSLNRDWRYSPKALPEAREATFDDGAFEKVTLPRIEGYVAGKLAISRTFSGKDVDQKFLLLPDDSELVADGGDTTRVVLRVTDEFDAVRPFASDAIRFELSGPAVIIGDNPMALIGGTSAIWIRATEQPGKVILTAHHPHLCRQTVKLQMLRAAAETV